MGITRHEADIFRELAPRILAFALHIDAHKETRDTDGWILAAPNGKPAGLVENNYPGRAGRGQVERTGVPLRMTDILGWILTSQYSTGRDSPAAMT
jgi:hypothetical protein